MKISAYLQSLVTLALLSAISVTSANDTTFTATNPAKTRMRESFKDFRDHSMRKLQDHQFLQLGNDVNGESSGDNFGRSVSISGDGKTMVVGAHKNDGNGSWSGSVRVYRLSNTNNDWNQLGEDIDGEAAGDSSGDAVSLSADGTTVAVGAYGNDGNGSDSGHVRIYRLSNTNDNWNQLGEDIDGEAAGDYSGYAVSLSADGTTVAVGAKYNDGNGNNSGSVRVYRLSNANNDWNQLGEDIDGEAANDTSGWAVSLSADGTTVTVGARENQANGFKSGHVRIYRLSNTDNDWIKLGEDIDGEAAGDYSGTAVSLSADGTTFAVGAPGASHVRVFQIVSPPPSASPTASLTASPSASPTASPTASTSPTTSPYVKGDPHFMTWAGKTYDFHGVCDLVLVHVERFGKGIGMDIHIRSKKMKMWSFVASVAVCIGKDIFEVIGGKEPKVFTNGIEGKMKNTKDEISLTTTIAGFPVHRMNKSKKGEKFAINLGNNEKLVISTWHFFVSVSFENARSETFGDSVGLLGSFSGGMKLARDGTTIITDLNEYGQEWQVRDSEPHLFHSIEGPQYPLKCDIPSSTEMRHRLEESKLTTNEARKACDNVNQYELNLCIFDVLATNNKSTAGAY